MSGSKQKLKRQEDRKLGVDKRQFRNQQLERKQRKQRIYGIIAGAFIVISLALITFFKSNLFYRSFTAVKIDDVEYSVADFNYYYYNLYYNYYNSYYSSYGEYANYLMPKEDELEKNTIEMMKETAMLYTKAQEADYKLSENGKKQIESSMEALDKNAEAAGYSSVNKYLKASYRGGVNDKVYKDNLERYTLAMEYGESILKENTFSDKELADYYKANKDKYDQIDYRSFFIDGSAATDDEKKENNSDADSKKAMADAKAKAEEFKSKITDEKSFNTLAYEYADEASKENYSDKDATLVSSQGQNIDTAYSKWLLEGDRKAGDNTVIEATNGYYVLYFIGRDDNSYDTVNVRHILIKPEEVVKADYDSEDDYKAAQEEADKKAKAEAEEIYSKWKSGDATEEDFGDLADEHSDDSPVGGLYNNVAKGRMVKEFNDWIFAENRKPGDSAVVKTDYGYHIMYFVDKGMKYSDYLADTDLKSEAYDKWVNENIKDFTADQKWPFKFVH